MFARLRHWLTFHIRYLRRPPWDTGVTPSELHAFIAQHPPGRALDMGCGTGTNAVTLGQSGWSVVGVDFVGKAVRRARRRVQASGMEERVAILRGDVARLEGVEGRFDLILDIGCYHGLPPEAQAGYQRNVERLLARGGWWLMYTRCRPESAEAIGISEAHIRRLKERWKLVERQDGFDRADIPAAWLTFYNGNDA